MSRKVYDVQFATGAARQFRKLTKDVQRRLRPAIDSLADDPRPRGVKKMAGADDLYRIRVGDFRIVYETNDAEVVVLIVIVADRRESYR